MKHKFITCFGNHGNFCSIHGKHCAPASLPVKEECTDDMHGNNINNFGWCASCTPPICTCPLPKGEHHLATCPVINLSTPLIQEHNFHKKDCLQCEGRWCDTHNWHCALPVKKRCKKCQLEGNTGICDQCDPTRKCTCEKIKENGDGTAWVVGNPNCLVHYPSPVSKDCTNKDCPVTNIKHSHSFPPVSCTREDHKHLKQPHTHDISFMGGPVASGDNKEEPCGCGCHCTKRKHTCDGETDSCPHCELSIHQGQQEWEDEFDKYWYVSKNRTKGSTNAHRYEIKVFIRLLLKADNQEKLEAEPATSEAPMPTTESWEHSKEYADAIGTIAFNGSPAKMTAFIHQLLTEERKRK